MKFALYQSRSYCKYALLFRQMCTTTVNSEPTCKEFSDMPGPIGPFGLGSFYNYFPVIGKYSWEELHTSGLKKYKKYGSIVRERIYPGVDLVYLFDPNDIAVVLNDMNNAKGYPQRKSHLALEKYRNERTEVYRSAGLLPTNGPEWWRLRSELQKGLSSPKHVRGFLPDVDIVTNDFLDNLKADAVIDVLPEISRLNLELTCLLAFDERMDSFSEEERKPTSRSSRLMHATKISNTCILPTDQGFLWRLFETPTYKKLKKSQIYIESLAIDFVSQKISYYKEDSDSACIANSSRCSILEEYLKNPNLDLSDIVGMAVDLLMAGVETTTFSTCFAIYHLARNSEVQEKLFVEACNVLNDHDDPITPETLNSKIPYTRAVLKESLRLNPISVGVGRILNADTILGGYKVPEGTVIVTQNMVACQLACNFENPDKFLPERWLNRKNNINPYLVLPFGHGMRACIARRLAEQSMLVFLLRLVRKYSIEWSGVEEMRIKTYLINNPVQPMNVTLRRRQYVRN